MRNQWKRNAVVATVLLFVCAAVYLNWRYAGNVVDSAAPASGQEDGEGSTKVLGDATLVGGVGQENVEQAVLDDANRAIQTLAGYSMLEGQIENLVVAKGYADCVAFMGENSISVVVSAAEDGLQTEDVAKITDIVLSETDYTAGQIKIMEAE